MGLTRDAREPDSRQLPLPDAQFWLRDSSEILPEGSCWIDAHVIEYLSWPEKLQ
jgi:hypothetical protein